MRASPLQSNFNGGQVSPLIYGRPDLDKYQTGLKRCRNFIPVLQGPVERRPGTQHIAEVKDSTKQVRLQRFEFSTEQPYVLEFGDQYFRIFKDRGQVVSGTPVEVVTPYLEAELFSLRFAQSADILYVAHRNHAPRKITRTSDTSWTISTIEFLDGPYLNTNATTTTLGLSATSGSVTVTASATTGINFGDGFQSTDVGRLIRWKDAANNWTWLKITAVGSTTSVTATIEGNNASATTATTEWRLGVWSGTTGYPAAVTFHQNRLCWGGATEYPQRVDMSRTSAFEDFQPTDLDGTVLDDNAVATTLSADSVNAIRWMADDAKGLVIGTVGGEWLIRPNDNGGVITPSNVQGTRSSAYGSADIQPVRVGNNLIMVQRSRRKIRELGYVFEDDGFRAPDMSLVAENITRSGITQLAYQAEPQSNVWASLSNGTLVGMTYDKDQRIIGFHDHIVGGTVDAFGNGIAEVESVSCIPNPSDDADDLYLVVKRYINGGIKRYVEFLKEFWNEDRDPEAAFFVDSGLSLDDPKTITAITQADPGVVTTSAAHGFSNGDFVRFTDIFGMTELNNKVYTVANVTATTFEIQTQAGVDVDTSGFTAYEENGKVRESVLTVSGLDHLEGQTVSILTEGAAHPDKVVSSGSVTLDRRASLVVVGLAYNSDIETLRYEAGAQDGTAQGKTQRIHRVILRFLRTLGGKYGINDSDLVPFVYRSGGDPMDQSVPLFSGDVELEWDGRYSKEANIFIRQDQPLPMTLQAIMPQLVTQDR